MTKLPFLTTLKGGFFTFNFTTVDSSGLDAGGGRLHRINHNRERERRGINTTTTIAQLSLPAGGYQLYNAVQVVWLVYVVSVRYGWILLVYSNVRDDVTQRKRFWDLI
jgi:hypothetical protein